MKKKQMYEISLILFYSFFFFFWGGGGELMIISLTSQGIVA